MLIPASVGTAQAPEPKNSTGSPVSFVMRMLTMPSCGSSIHDHTSAVTTPEMRNGRIISPRTVADAASRCRITAVTSETSTPKTTERPTK